MTVRELTAILNTLPPSLPISLGSDLSGDLARQQLPGLRRHEPGLPGRQHGYLLPPGRTAAAAAHRGGPAMTWIQIVLLLLAPGRPTATVHRHRRPQRQR